MLCAAGHDLATTNESYHWPSPGAGSRPACIIVLANNQAVSVGRLLTPLAHPWYSGRWKARRW